MGNQQGPRKEGKRQHHQKGKGEEPKGKASQKRLAVGRWRVEGRKGVEVDQGEELGMGIQLEMEEGHREVDRRRKGM